LNLALTCPLPLHWGHVTYFLPLHLLHVAIPFPPLRSTKHLYVSVSWLPIVAFIIPASVILSKIPEMIAQLVRDV
jgi:hypothetical protein